MASPKSVKSSSPVAPAAPAEPLEAVTADPGEASAFSAAQASRAAVALSSTTVGGGRRSGRSDPTKTSWIEVELVDENGKGIPSTPFEVIAPDGSVFSGTTNELGIGRVSGIDPGNYDITFPKLDKDAWEPA